MSKPYMTREGGATVTVFVPYDCRNNCPFCINKREYADTTGFSVEKIRRSIEILSGITPRCDFVFTGGEPLAEPDTLQEMLDIVPGSHRVFINTTLPVMAGRTQEGLAAFLNRNRDKITCVNVSRHIRKYVEEGGDGIFDLLKLPARINCVLYGAYTPEDVAAFVERFRKKNLPIQFRFDYTETTPENLYDEAGDPVFRLLDGLFGCTGASGCRMRCNYNFGSGSPPISYHKTLPYSTIPVSKDGIEYNVLYDVIVKQNGDIHSDWDGTPLNVEKYRRTAYEPYDLHDFTPGGTYGEAG